MWIDLGEGVVCQAVGFYTVYSRGKHFILEWKHSRVSFWDPLRVSRAAWGLAVIAPLWCLSCAHHNVITTFRETAPRRVRLLLTAKIMRGIKLKNKLLCIFLALHTVFPLKTLSFHAPGRNLEKLVLRFGSQVYTSDHNLKKRPRTQHAWPPCSLNGCSTHSERHCFFIKTLMDGGFPSACFCYYVVVSCAVIGWGQLG